MATKAQKRAYDRARYVADPESPRTRTARWRQANPSRARLTVRTWYRAHPNETRASRLNKHGITQEEWNGLFAYQNGLCASCGQPPNGRWKMLAVDHDHDTGDIRGLLCSSCNANDMLSVLLPYAVPGVGAWT